jgi:glucokinase
MHTILAADIGGTSSRFAWFELHDAALLSLRHSIWLPTRDAASFHELLAALRASSFPHAPDEADIAVFAVAGPVENGSRCLPPNIAWEIDLTGSELAGVLPPTVLINDFVAQAYASRSPIADGARSILPGRAVTDAVIAVVGAGTGLGKAALVPLDHGRYRALPSEGGHALFPFVSPREQAYAEFLRQKSGQPQLIGDLVVSGNGLRYLHWFLSGEELSARDVTARLQPNSETLAWAATFYGRVCRNFALEVLARGGIYIAGGVAARSPQLLTHPNFQREFIDCPAMSHLLQDIPVWLIDNQESGLWGAAWHGGQLLA